MSKLPLVNINNVDVSKINLSGDELYLDDKPLMIVTDYVNVEYDTQYKTLKVSLDNNDKLLKICRKIDKLTIDQQQFNNSIFSPLAKEYRNEKILKFKMNDGAGAFKEKIPVQDIKKLCKECDIKLILKCGKVYDYKGYYGVGIKCVQMLGKEKKNSKSSNTFDECLFD